MSYAKPAPLPRLSLGVWQANGIRLAVLPLEDWPAFYAEMPEPLSVRQTRVLASDAPVAVVTSPRLVRPIRIDLTVPPMRSREKWVRRGRLRLLAEISAPDVAALAADASADDANADGGRSMRNALDARHVTLVPHQLLPRQIVLPETLRDDPMPGVVFERLALRMELPADQLLLLAMDRPWDRESPEPPGDESNGEKTNGDQSSPDEPNEQSGDGRSPANEGIADGAASASTEDHGSDSQPRRKDAGDEKQAEGASSGEEDGKSEDGGEIAPRDEPPVFEVPPHLGRALLAAEKWGRPVQRLVVILIRPLPSP